MAESIYTHFSPKLAAARFAYISRIDPDKRGSALVGRVDWLGKTVMDLLARFDRQEHGLNEPLFTSTELSTAIGVGNVTFIKVVLPRLVDMRCVERIDSHKRERSCLYRAMRPITYAALSYNALMLAYGCAYIPQWRDASEARALALQVDAQMAATFDTASPESGIHDAGLLPATEQHEELRVHRGLVATASWYSALTNTQDDVRTAIQKAPSRREVALRPRAGLQT